MITKFYQPTEAEQAKIILVKQTISRLSAAISAVADNHATFGDMIFCTSNKERWQWIKLLKPFAEFYNRINRTSVNPTTGINHIDEETPKRTSREFLTTDDLTDEERGILMQLADLQLLRVKAIARAICVGELLTANNDTYGRLAGNVSESHVLGQPHDSEV
jgi:hypothetical protein